eukprot:652376-Rhodomonas_salina.17
MLARDLTTPAHKRRACRAGINDTNDSGRMHAILHTDAFFSGWNSRTKHRMETHGRRTRDSCAGFRISTTGSEPQRGVEARRSSNASDNLHKAGRDGRWQASEAECLSGAQLDGRREEEGEGGREGGGRDDGKGPRWG